MECVGPSLCTRRKSLPKEVRGVQQSRERFLRFDRDRGRLNGTLPHSVFIRAHFPFLQEVADIGGTRATPSPSFSGFRASSYPPGNN
jgi:hypothetical protein